MRTLEVFGKGDLFRENGGEIYLLAQVDPSIMTLICLGTGNRFNDVKLAVSDPTEVTPEEFKRLSDGAGELTYVGRFFK